MNKKLVNILKYLLSFGLAGLLVWLAFRGIDWHEFWVGLKATRWGWIALYLVVGYLALVFRALRWTQLIHPSTTISTTARSGMPTISEAWPA